MSTASISVPEVDDKLTARLGHAWAGVLGRLRRSRVQLAGQTMTDCFGKLTDKDEMVAKGLMAGFACAVERGHGGR